MMRRLLDLGSVAAFAPAQAARAFAAAPKATLAEYVESIRTQIADSYFERVEKYEGYLTEFQQYMSSTGLPRARDFTAVEDFANKRAAMLKKVGFPDDWKVSGPVAEEIQSLLGNIAAEKKAAAASGGAAPWYHGLTDAQVKKCQANPQLFVELSKMHAFEEQFTTAAEAQATKFGLPAVTLEELPKTMDATDEYMISEKEVQWIVQTAKQSAASIRSSDPKYADPFNTDEFKARQVQVGEKLGASSEEVTKMQQSMNPGKWKQFAADMGYA